MAIRVKRNRPRSHRPRRGAETRRPRQRGPRILPQARDGALAPRQEDARARRRPRDTGRRADGGVKTHRAHERDHGRGRKTHPAHERGRFSPGKCPPLTSAVDFHSESALRSRARPIFAPKQHPAHERGENDRMKQQNEVKQ